jgi:hypothetical protein
MHPQKSPELLVSSPVCFVLVTEAAERSHPDETLRASAQPMLTIRVTIS